MAEYINKRRQLFTPLIEHLTIPLPDVIAAKHSGRTISARAVPKYGSFSRSLSRRPH
jgi:hypothetical protein